MAQVDTGMGWRAKDTWLMPGVGDLASQSGILTTGDPLPGVPVMDNPTGDEVWAEGLVINIPIWKPGGSRTWWEYHVAASKPGTYVYFLSGTNAQICAITSDIDTVLYMASEHDTSTSPTFETGTFNSAGSYAVTGGTVYFKYVVTGTPTAVVPDYVTHANAATLLSVGDTNYYKMNAGYAVACVAQWYTPEGTELISPILISTASLSTAISENMTTPSSDMSSFSFLLDGLRFYMSIIGGNSDPLTTSLPYADLRQFAAAAPSKVFSLIASESFANIEIYNSPDPYQENAEEEGGDGEDPEDDPVEEQTNPIPNAGIFGTIYIPTTQELGQMKAYLWSGAFDVSQVIKLFSNPLDSIIGLSAVPLDLSNSVVSPAEQIYLGGVALPNITMHRFNGRTAIKVDMGTVNIAERFGAYLDYDPYTQFSIYLPFVGYKSIKADDIMGKTISLMYDIDILTGACVAYIRPNGGSVMYEWSGQCAIQIPVTSASWDNIFRTAISTAVTLGTAMFAQPSAPVLAGAVASAASQAFATKPHIERSGAVSGSTGFLGQLRPYIVRTIPEAYIPAEQNKQIGYPAYINVSLGSISGYNEVASVHLENIPATGDELSEIESLLKGGAIF